MNQRVSFYILKGESARDALLFACRLTEKAWKLNLNIALYMSNKHDTDDMDALLWSFRETSFLPHSIADKNQQPDSSIILSDDETLLGKADLLINISHTLPEKLPNYGRIAEIVPDRDPERSHARQRFKDYRQMGHPLDSHTVDLTGH